MAFVYSRAASGPARLSSYGQMARSRRRFRELSRAERVRLVLRSALIVTAILITGGISYGYCWFRSVAQSLPPVHGLAGTRVSPLTRIVSSDGVLLAALQTRFQRPVPLDHMSPFLIDATIATEDSRFFQHGGIDPRGILRAFWANIIHGNPDGQGGSTITQQLARIDYLSPEKTLTRKVQEMLLARKIEQTYTKRQILEAYLNTVYYGSGSYGVEAASRTYFGTSAKDLTLGEASLLAGLPQRPSAYTPTKNLQAALNRRAVVLDRMVATGKITPAQKQAAEAAPLPLLRPHIPNSADWRAPYFVRHVVTQLEDQVDPSFLTSGAEIVTTLNWKMQQAAERALHEGLRRHAGPTTGALVSIDPRTGYVRALVGGADFRRDQFDAVTQGVRQPGSAFKPFVYAAAFDANLCNLLSKAADQELVYPGLEKNVVIHNYDRRYRGSVTILDALRFSINTVAVQTAEQIGLSGVAWEARQLGISTPLDLTPSLALGASGVRPLDLCSAYSAFANQGSRCEPAFILSIRDAQGDPLYQDNINARLHPDLMSDHTLNQINIALRQVVLSGTGRDAASIPDAHGKTGTTNSLRDAWFAGYTADLATVVWMAHPHKATTKVNGNQEERTVYAPMPGATGGRLCAPVWRGFMAAALPEQQRINQARGIPEAPIPGPTLAEIAPDLQQEAQQIAANLNPQDAAPQTPADGQSPPLDDQAAAPADNQAPGVYDFPPLYRVSSSQAALP